MLEVCSAAANKILKKLTEEKEFLLGEESQKKSYTVSLTENVEDAIIPEYNFIETQKKLEDLEDKILKIKHAINQFNSQTEVLPGITVDMALIRMAMLTNRLATLKKFKAMPEISAINTSYQSASYRIYTNFDAKEINAEYEKYTKELTDLQLALDKANMINTFKIDVEI